MRAMESTVNEA